MPNLSIHFEEENVGAVRDDFTGEVRIEVRFLGAAENLTDRAKAEIVVAAQTEYFRQAHRLIEGGLGFMDVWNPDGTIGKEMEVKPIAPPI